MGANETAIVALEFRENSKAVKGAMLKENPVLKQARAELDQYFAGERRDFSVPIDPQGTQFQRRVWKALQTIPYGETRSYKDIAIAAGCPKGFRAVGLANNRNPISIIIPCHRVIGSNNKLVGYGGGLAVKEFLLNLERKQSS